MKNSTLFDAASLAQTAYVKSLQPGDTGSILRQKLLAVQTGVSRNQVVDMVNLYIRLTATSGSVVNQYRYAANTSNIEVSGTANGLGLITAATPLNDKSYGKFFRSLIIDRILRQPVLSKPGVC